MKSVMFKGKDKFDLDRQEWDWKQVNPMFAVKKIHTDENLPIDLTKPTAPFAKKNPAPDWLTRLIEYEDRN
jgi:hypothetical protein